MNISEILLYFPTIILACALIILSIIAIAILPWSPKEFQQGKEEAQYVMIQIKFLVKEIWIHFLDPKHSDHKNISQSFTDEIAEDITGIRRRRAM